MTERNFKQLFTSEKLESSLQFTKEDRNNVFKKLHENANVYSKHKNGPLLTKKVVPAFITVMALGICLFLLMQTLLSGEGDLAGESSGTPIIDNVNGTATSVINDSSTVTSLVTVKSKEMDNRIYVNLLFSYDRKNQLMKVVSLPSDLLVPVKRNADQSITHDKLLFAYQYGNEDTVRKSISMLFDLPIDFYAIIDLESVNSLVEQFNGIPFELQDETRIRAITKQAMELEQGTHLLNGEQLVSLVMAATEGLLLEKEVLVTLLEEVLQKVTNELSPTELQNLFAQIETNGTLEGLHDKLASIQSLQLVSIKDSLVTDKMVFDENETSFIYKLEQEIIQSITKELTKLEKNK